MYLEKYRLAGQVAFVTGGGRGIGLATAEALLEAGATVVISDRDGGVLANGRADLARKGHPVEAMLLDVTKSADVRKAAEGVVAQHGKVDILIANAGVAHPDTPGEEMSDAVWSRIVDVNLNGSYWCCREFGRHMVGAGRGAIVTLGSISGLISNKPQRQVHYNVAKAAVHHMTKCLAGEWAERGVRVNCVAPTYVDTVMSSGGFDQPMFKTWMENTPMKRVATADEIASSILFLATDASSAVTGSVLVVDCGYTIW